MAPQPKRKLDYSDYLATPDGSTRYELLDGELVVNPCPSPMHQRVSKRLQRQLEDYFEERGIGEVFNAPIDAILTPHDVFVPDLLVVADQQHISRRGIEAPPLLVVEILSPSTRNYDRGLKPRRYAALGVLHYWIVDPDAQRLECFRLADGVFHPVANAEGDTSLAHPEWDALVVDLAALWRSR